MIIKDFNFKIILNLILIYNSKYKELIAIINVKYLH